MKKLPKGTSAAKMLAYAEEQRIITMRNRLELIEEKVYLDHTQTTTLKDSIITLERDRTNHEQWLLRFAALGFWGRLRWLLNGKGGYRAEVKDFYCSGEKV